MAIATSFNEIKRFTASVTSLGGTLPKRILSSYDVMAAPAGAQRQDDPIVDAAMAGELTAEKLAELLPAAALASLSNTYRQELSRSTEHILVNAWHQQVKAGGADAILSSLRSRFSKAAEQIELAKSLGINAESSLEHIVETAQPGVLEAWRSLKDQILIVSRIGRVAAQFGAQNTAMFPQIRQYNLGDNARLTDEALMCCDEANLAVDSAPFRRPDQGHRTSPWFQTSLKLHSVESATERYNRWAADEFDQMHSGPRGGRLIDGQMVPDPVPVNPYRAKTSVR